MRSSFYRDPTGKAYKGEDGKHAPNQLLSKIGRSSLINEAGVVAWSVRSWTDNAHDAIYSSIAIQSPSNEELNSGDTNSIVSQALQELSRNSPGKPYNPAELLRVCDKFASAFFRRELKKYTLVTSLSLEKLPKKSISVFDSTVFQITNPKKYELPKILSDPMSCPSKFQGHLNGTQYSSIGVRTNARSHSEAVAKSLDSINLLRAVWSFVSTYGKITFHIGSNTRKPLGDIHLGPVHLLYENKSLVNKDYWWYEPCYISDQDIFSPVKSWDQWEKHRNWAFRQIKRLIYGADLKTIFLRYIDALDQHDPNVAFLMLWGILEKITDTVGSQYDETIKRTCWIYPNNERGIIKEMLGVLRQSRNRYVHGSVSTAETSNLASKIKFFIDPHLKWLLNNKFRVKSFKEYGEFLSQPTDAKILSRNQFWTNLSLKRNKQDQADEN